MRHLRSWMVVGALAAVVGCGSDAPDGAGGSGATSGTPATGPGTTTGSATTGSAATTSGSAATTGSSSTASTSASDASSSASGGGEGGAAVSSSASTGSTSSSVSSASSASSGSSGSGGGSCDLACGPSELCDGVHKGVDDNCDGNVDEGCPCTPGEAESCFMGDPTYLSEPMCHPGTQLCGPAGTWLACQGGSHPTDGIPCETIDPTGCHPISTTPFAPTDLTAGIGSFNAGGTAVGYSLTCPAGPTSCPVPDGAGSVQPPVSGEYTVTYDGIDGGGTPVSCSFPLYVGAKGLRVELGWELGNTDLDIHLHQPGTVTPFAQGDNGECGYSNCKSGTYQFAGGGAEWFPMPPVAPGLPVAWDLEPVFADNTCYNAPRGEGLNWQSIGLGCHNPRLETDTISCDPSVLDPSNDAFCSPETLAVDEMPANTWTRMAVHYYPGTSTATTPVHPEVKVFCDGALAADLGPGGYNNPITPITWQHATDLDHMWIVGDVEVVTDACSAKCRVQPIYAGGDATAKLPLYQPAYGGTFGPAYPPP